VALGDLDGGQCDQIVFSAFSTKMVEESPKIETNLGNIFSLNDELPKNVSKLSPYLYYFFPNGKMLPNLVTLLATAVLITSSTAFSPLFPTETL
jgi:hypothetical protein